MLSKAINEFENRQEPLAFWFCFHVVCYFIADIEVSIFLLRHVVVVPDHLPFASHIRTLDPASRYPKLQEKEAWEPNDQPHEREVMAPKIGGWRTGQVFSVNIKFFTVNNLITAVFFLTPQFFFDILYFIFFCYFKRHLTLTSLIPWLISMIPFIKDQNTFLIWLLMAVCNKSHHAILCDYHSK